MNIWCHVFGHRTDPSRLNGHYVTLGHPHTDGVDRVHVTVNARCSDCGTKFRIGMAHLPREYSKKSG